MESAIDWHTARALLEWQLEMGVDEAISDLPVDRYAFEAEAKAKAEARRNATATAAPTPVRPKQVDPVEEAAKAASSAMDLPGLRAALGAYEHCQLKKGARNLVFSDGTPGAPVMIIGEAPERDDDLQGKPFAGAPGALLDKMLDPIGLGRDRNVYATYVLPWRPPRNRDPRPDEIAMLKPFLLRHIALAKPKVLLLSGNIACQVLLGKRGITRLRGQWAEVQGLPALPMLSPAKIAPSPQAKRDTWADLLSLKAKLRELT